MKISAESPEFYSVDDFERVEKIDIHVHINSLDLAFIEQAEKDNFALLTINADYSEFPSIIRQQEIAVSLSQRYPKRLAFASTFSMNGWDDPGWKEKTIEHIDRTISEGARGVKVWKNIGMEYRDRNNNLVMIDHPKFDPIFSHLKIKNIPLIGHLGEPRDCWLPHDKIMVRYIRDYFKDHPQYHMYLQPEMPSYEDQMKARDTMLEKNKNLVFMGAHLASLEWSVVELAKFLDRFPNAVADMAARVGDVQYQTVKNREVVRDFFIRYQDRVLYGTDMIQQPGIDAAQFRADLHNQWTRDWKFLCTDSSLTVPDLEQPIKGLGLPSNVIDKVYRLNAQRVFPNAWRNM
ncbi:MAG: amidohydrolase family protein [Bacteroidota bacterium]